MKKSLAVGMLAGAALFVASENAQAQSILTSPGAHEVKTEIEIHGVFNYGGGWGSGWGGGGGLGLRVGIPLIGQGPLAGVNNSLNLGLGADLLFYWGRAGNALDWMTLVVPVNLQWNFYLLGPLSLFVEGGLALGIDFCGASGGCGWIWLWPGLAIGGRVHFGGHAGFPALTFRLGFPTGFNLGISF